MVVVFTVAAEPSTNGEVILSLTTSDNGSSAEATFAEIRVHDVKPLRDNWRMSKSIGILPAPGAQTDIVLEGLEPGLYAVSLVLTPESNWSPVDADLTGAGDVCFDLPATLTADEARAQVKEVRRRRQELATQITVAKNSTEDSPVFAAIIYFSGVRLHSPFLLEGAEVYPVEGHVGVEGVEAPLVADIARVFSVDVPFSDQAKAEFEAANAIFAVRLFGVRANGAPEAAQFAFNYANDVARLISIERGEAPKHCATFVAGEDGVAFYPTFNDYLGNLLGPMFSNEHPEMVEDRQPIMARSDYARLLVTLLSEAVGERDAALQHWRCWIIIEQIAKKHIGSNFNLSHPDGRPILHRNGSAATTSGARGKVYQYLITHGFPAFNLFKKDSNGLSLWIEGVTSNSADPERNVIPLWEAVGAMYEVRNNVAHSGQVSMSTPPTETELLADLILSAHSFTSGFLYGITSEAVWRELEGER